MNPPQVYMCSPSWTLLLSPSPYHPSGSSQCTSPKHPVSCIEPGLATRFSYMIFYMFQCHSPKSSHPLPLLTWFFTFFLRVLYLMHFWKSQGKSFCTVFIEEWKILWWWVLTLGLEQEGMQFLLSFLYSIPCLPCWLITYTEWTFGQKFQDSSTFNIQHFMPLTLQFTLQVLFVQKF